MCPVLPHRYTECLRSSYLKYITGCEITRFSRSSAGGSTAPVGRAMAPAAARGRPVGGRRPLAGFEAYQGPPERQQKCVNPCTLYFCGNFGAGRLPRSAARGSAVSAPPTPTRSAGCTCSAAPARAVGHGNPDARRARRGRGARAVRARDARGSGGERRRPLESARLDVQLGYGFAAFGDRFTATPELGLGPSPPTDASTGSGGGSGSRGAGRCRSSSGSRRRAPSPPTAPDPRRARNPSTVLGST